MKTEQMSGGDELEMSKLSAPPIFATQAGGGTYSAEANVCLRHVDCGTSRDRYESKLHRVERRAAVLVLEAEEDLSPKILVDRAYLVHVAG
jgi:hypothetical protein